MKKLIILLLAVVFAVGMSFLGIGCKKAEEVKAPAEEEAAPAEEEEAAPAEEEVVEEAPDLSDLEVVLVVKADGIPWFDAERRGLDKCAEDYGFKASTVGPPTADAALQAQMIEDYIAKGVDAIGVVPNDPASIEPVFKKAMDAGIITFGHEAATMANQDVCVEAMSNEAFGETMFSDGAGYAGEEGGFVWSVGWLTSVSHNQWVDAGLALQKEKYPNMVNLLGEGGRFEEEENTTIAHDKIVEFINTYPELKLVLGCPMTTGPAAALAFEETGNIGKMFFTGTGLPVTIGDYLREGVVQEGLFWDPYRVGYAMGLAVMKIYLGEGIKDGETFAWKDGDPIPGYESIKVTTNDKGSTVVYANAICKITKDNIDEWDAQFKEYGF